MSQICADKDLVQEQSNAKKINEVTTISCINSRKDMQMFYFITIFFFLSKHVPFCFTLLSFVMPDLQSILQHVIELNSCTGVGKSYKFVCISFLQATW